MKKSQLKELDKSNKKTSEHNYSSKGIIKKADKNKANSREL
jgi:hypothetical protein